MIGLVPSPGLYCHLCETNGCLATLRGATRVRPPRQEPDGCRHSPGRCCSPQALGPFSCRYKEGGGALGQGRPGPPHPALFAQRELPDGEGQGPTGLQRSCSGWVRGCSFEVISSRSAKPRPAPFRPLAPPVHGPPTKERVGVPGPPQGRWPRAPIRRAPQFCTCAAFSKEVSRHCTRPPTGLRNVFPCLI